MTISSIPVITNRIKSAKPTSKIAIFKKVRYGEVIYDAVFDRTVNTQQRIASGDEIYLGSFSGLTLSEWRV